MNWTGVSRASASAPRFMAQASACGARVEIQSTAVGYCLSKRAGRIRTSSSRPPACLEAAEPGCVEGHEDDGGRVRAAAEEAGQHQVGGYDRQHGKQPADSDAGGRQSLKSCCNQHTRSEPLQSTPCMPRPACTHPPGEARGQPPVQGLDPGSGQHREPQHQGQGLPEVDAQVLTAPGRHACHYGCQLTNDDCGGEGGGTMA